MAKALILGVLLSLLLAFWLNRPSDNITIPEETWWCPGNEAKVDKSIKPYRVVFTKDMVQDLKYRLNHTRKITESLAGSEWSYGVGGNSFEKVIDYWLNKYDFKSREAYLNKYPHFITNVQGLDIHFIHVKPEKAANKKVVPLLLQHGWPGSVVEFYKIIPMLTTPRPEYDFVFEVVAPSLPGMGFSSAATIPGLGSTQMAVVLKNLMLKLGHQSWYTQGGDWGAIITSDMAAMYPEHVRGMHSNMCTVLTPCSMVKSILFSLMPSLITTEQTRPLMYPLMEHWGALVRESGYFHIQATKPDTIGIALNDSPAGLAAYILEKFAVATNGKDGLKANSRISDKFEMDELFDNLMLYWVKGTATTAARIYAETVKYTNVFSSSRMPVKVPSYCAQFPNEISYQPPFILSEKYKDLRRAKLMPRGGHFAAMEEPRLLSDDIWSAFAELEAPPPAESGITN